MLLETIENLLSLVSGLIGSRGITFIPVSKQNQFTGFGVHDEAK